MNFGLYGKTALVTASSKGIGKAVAEALAAEGCQVAISSRTKSDLLQTADEIKTTIFSAIERLPEDLKSAITLREIDGLSYEEIAQVMDCPIGTVRSRIFRARDVIDKELRPLLE